MDYEHEQDKNMEIGQAYGLQSVMVWMFHYVVPSISIRKVRHHDERFFIKNICTKEFW